MSTATGEYPFDNSGIGTGADRIRRYRGLQENLVELLRNTAEQHPDRTAIIELGGPTATYAEIWNRARRVAGGLRNAGVATGDRWPSSSAMGWTGSSPSGARTSPAPLSSR